MNEEEAASRDPTEEPVASGSTTSDGYDHETVEREWQAAWNDAGVFEAPENPDPESVAYVLAMFPYTSGELHMGHVRNYAITDAYSRYRRMCGDDVLHPMGWDGFGLPAENAALEARAEDADAAVDPGSYTRECIAAMRADFESLGMGFDWSREFATCDPEYYRWNQWLFTAFREAGLVDRRERAVNWCPDCETVLADEQVETDGGDPDPTEVCWRCDTEIGERDLEQWFFRITEYADELLEGLDDLSEWPASVRDQQRNWIGRTEGAEVDFAVRVPDGTEHDVTVFTTRLDTIHGATYFAVAPDHPLAAAAAERDPAVREFVDDVADHEAPRASERSSGRSPRDEPQGVATDMTATNPATGEEIPVYVADFVLSDVGTGALMAVPGHDERDHAFAREHDLEIRPVVEPAPDAPVDADDVDEAAFTDDGVLVNSGEYDGTASADAREALTDALPSAEAATQYRLRDWGISRQRYWGTPIPVVHCPDCGPVSVPDDELPVELPEFVASTGNPLDAATDWTQTACPDCGRDAERETDTMDTFVGSSWYYARFAGGPRAVADGAAAGSATTGDGSTEYAPFDRDVANGWLPVDEYVGGSEHAVMHLLYARFVAKALRDLGHLDVDEPFAGLTTQGMVLGEDGAKMSKSRDNGVSPTRIVREYGADTARAFVLGAAEPERDVAWDPDGVARRRRLLDRILALARDAADAYEHDSDTARDGRGSGGGGSGGDDARDRGSSGGDAESAAWASTTDRGLSPTDEYVAREVDATVDAVTEAYEAMRFDRVARDVDALVSLVARYREGARTDPAVVARAASVVVRALAPIAPHVCEEAWAALHAGTATGGDDGFAATAPWPTAERDLAAYAAASRLVERTREDVRDIVDTAGIDDPERVRVVVAPEWTYDALERATDAVGRSGGDPGEVTSAIMADASMRERGDAASSYARDLAESGRFPANLGAAREREALARGAWLLEREFGADVVVQAASEAPADVVERARPGRPAIRVD
jgi:leucyl-tRNA synthetase